MLQAVGYDAALAAPLLKPEDIDFAALGTQHTKIDGAHNRGITLSQLQKERKPCSFFYFLGLIYMALLILDKRHLLGTICSQ